MRRMSCQLLGGAGGGGEVLVGEMIVTGGMLTQHTIPTRQRGTGIFQRYLAGASG